MKPLNLDNSPCTPISSNCVIWQGPNIPCIKLCTGDTVSDVVFKLATELCAILDTLNITNYDLACLNLNTCAPADFQQLIQLLISKICELENIPTDGGNPTTGPCPTDCIVAVAECLGGGTDTLLNYVNTIANKVCDIVDDIALLQGQITTLNVTVADLQEQINNFPIYELPDVTSPCPIDGNTTARLDIMFTGFLSDWCDFITATGSAADIAASITPACTLTDIISEPGWISPIGTLADAINNIWVSICYFYNKPVPTTEVTGSSGITVTSSTAGSVTTYDVSLTSPLSTLMPTGSVLPWAGTSITPPVGWLFCDGTVYDGSDPAYNPLFTVIGIAYNGAVPLGFFAVPDLASSIPVGKGPIADGYDLTVVGTAGGNRAETLLDSQIPTHTHDLSTGTLSGTTGSAGTHRHGIWADNNNTAGSGAITLTSDTGSDYDTTPQTGAEGNGAYLSDEGAHTHSLSGTLSGTTGNGSPALQGLPHGNMQPFVVMQYIIKL